MTTINTVFNTTKYNSNKFNDNNNHIKMTDIIKTSIDKAWEKIAPLPPLENFSPCNPLQGLEDLPFEDALLQGASYFQQYNIPEQMHAVNREMIKWCQVFFDRGQATIKMPNRHLGFFQSWRNIIYFDKNVIKNLTILQQIWLKNLTIQPNQVITECLVKLGLPQDKFEYFLTLILSTLAGWAGFVKYHDATTSTMYDFLAVRLVITCLIWPGAYKLIEWHEQATIQPPVDLLNTIKQQENHYKMKLLHTLKTQKKEQINNKFDAQFIFCIDVRSASLRQSIEKQGNYTTFGYAGFFELPISIKDSTSQKTLPSCPNLVDPIHVINTQQSKLQKLISIIKNLYHDMRHTFATPFSLTTFLGPCYGIAMLYKTFIPWYKIRRKQNNGIKQLNITPQIPLSDQCMYAEKLLRTMGLIDSFAAIVVFCGHGSLIDNNIYEASLGCSACNGRSGGINAQIIVAILNNKDVRYFLKAKGINIPDNTIFLAGQHNTVTDEVILYTTNQDPKIIKIRNDLQEARIINNQKRIQQINDKNPNKNNKIIQSASWSQTRPEWGLTNNASFIVGPRHITQDIDLEGRAFLHSYNWKDDSQGDALETILTASMIIAQKINAQYLFSAIDNISYGSGSKVSHNICSKIGVMQGNSSDLMSGLPLQSIYLNFQTCLHTPMRLLSIIYAPYKLIDQIIKRHKSLQKLLSNDWIKLVAFDPEINDFLHLSLDLKWHLITELQPQCND